MKSLPLKNLKEIMLTKNEPCWTNFERSYSSHCTFLSGIEEKYTWNFDSDIVLKVKLSQTSSIGDLNRVFWCDIYESISAAEQIFYRRAQTLMNSALSLAEAEDYLSSAVLTRSLLELAIWHVYHSATFELTVDALDKNVDDHIIDASGLQELILKLIWGTSTKEAQSEVKQLRVLKVCEKVAKSLTNGDDQVVSLEGMYDALCEYVHPNVEGNNLFLDFDINAGLKPAVETKIGIKLRQNHENSSNTISTILTAMTWCISASNFSNLKYGETRRLIAKKFNLKLHNTHKVLH